MTQTFIRLDRMQQGLYEVLGFALGARFSTPPTLSWGYGEQSFETTSDGGLISLSVIAGPSPLLRSQSRGRVIADTQSIDVRVTSASATRYSITLNQVNYAYQATGADTPTTIRDALLALIQQDESTGYASSATVALGPDALTISKAPTAGGLWQLRLAGPLVSEKGSGFRLSAKSASLVTVPGRSPCACSLPSKAPITCRPSTPGASDLAPKPRRKTSQLSLVRTGAPATPFLLQ